METRGRTDAAVLLPLFGWPDDPGLIFTERRADLRRHAGEISFPGGRQDEGDADFAATALREAEEEVGLSRGAVEVVAELEPLATQATGWLVHPFLGRVAPDTRWRLQETEIVGILTPAARTLADPSSRATLPFSSLWFREPLLVDGIDVEGHVLWGMTLRLLDDVLPRLLAGAWEV